MKVNIVPRHDDSLEVFKCPLLHSRCLPLDVLVEFKIEHDPCDHVHDGPVRTGLFSFPILQCSSVHYPTMSAFQTYRNR